MSLSWPNKNDAARGPRVVFLDRDGVINRDSADYVTAWEQFEFLPGSLAAIAALTAAGIEVIVITNQAAIARGLMTPETLEDMHQHLGRIVAQNGGRIKAIFHCPHHPDDRCSCRKPRPGMILQARDRYGLDLKQTIMIGDRAKDIDCGIQAGCGRTILVLSGLRDARPELQSNGLEPDRTAADLAAAVRDILGHRSNPP
ncbi:MAG: D-glycero-beta-D-manno-heptose 1,7-bisphosphate 7-phosphatase [Desulfosarcina sp.]|nr:D-glycero-beta-D-manno-heptose 1,7-bisphosphate 7-phosphatase [Desulfobacterales bacterium]